MLNTENLNRLKINTVFTRYKLINIGKLRILLKNDEVLLWIKLTCIAFVLFSLFFFCWLQDEKTNVYGLYSSTDGQFAAWYSKALLYWSKPFDFSVLNPFQGNSSLFLSNSSWWNPGALVLGLPLGTIKTYILSYSIYWIEIFVTLFLLARAFGLSVTESFFVPQVFLLALFPPFSKYFDSLFMSLAPFNAHLIAICNIFTILYIKMGEKKGVQANFLLLFPMAFFLFVLIMSGPLTILTYLPNYAILFCGITFHSSSVKSFCWKMGSLIMFAILLYALGIIDYYIGTIQYSSGAIGTNILSQGTSVEGNFVAWNQYNFCNHPDVSLFCAKNPISMLHWLGFIGGLLGMKFLKKQYRWLSMTYCICALIPDLFIFLSNCGILQGTLLKIRPVFLLWPIYPLHCIFFVLFVGMFCKFWDEAVVVINTNLKKIGLTIKIIRDYLISICIRAFNRITEIKLIRLSVVILAGSILWFYSLSKDAMPYSLPVKTKIIEFLEDQLEIQPGDTFKGSVITYIGSQDSHLRELINNNYSFDFSTSYKPIHYIRSRDQLSKIHKNKHMFSDLWTHNIPSIEEYGQWITFPIFNFFQQMLAQTGDEFYRNFLNVYKLDLRVLKALGTRFIVSDKKLSSEDLILKITQYSNGIESGVVQSALLIFKEKLKLLNNQDSIRREEFINDFFEKLEKRCPSAVNKHKQINDGWNEALFCAFPKEKDKIFLKREDIAAVGKYFLGYLKYKESIEIPLYLYEIKDSNLANYSPTQVITVNHIDNIFSLLRNPKFALDKKMIIQEPLDVKLKPARKSTLYFERNQINIQAESDGWSAILLPIQYSHCFKMENNGDSDLDSIRFLRANLIQSALIFKDSVDITLKFKFGIGNNSDCRLADIQDMKILGLEAGKIPINIDSN